MSHPVFKKQDFNFNQIQLKFMKGYSSPNARKDDTDY